MNIKGSTGRNKKQCLSRYCERLELRATWESETVMLSFLFNVIANGGSIKMKRNDDKGDFEYVFPGMLDEKKDEKEEVAK